MRPVIALLILMSREGQRRAAHARARPARAGFDYPPTDGASAIGKPHEASRKKNDAFFRSQLRPHMRNRKLGRSVTAAASLPVTPSRIRSWFLCREFFQPRRFFTLLIGLTGSASLIGAISAENAEFSHAAQ